MKLKDLLHQPIICQLDDHATGSEVIPCLAIGWLKEFNNRKITLVHWDVLCTCDETRQINIEEITLSRKSVTAIFPIKVGKNIL